MRDLNVHENTQVAGGEYLLISTESIVVGMDAVKEHCVRDLFNAQGPFHNIDFFTFRHNLNEQCVLGDDFALSIGFVTSANLID